MKLANKEGFLEETDKHHSTVGLGASSVSSFPFSAFLSQMWKKAVAIRVQGIHEGFWTGKGIPGRGYSMKKGVEARLRGRAGGQGRERPGLRGGTLCYSLTVLAGCESRAVQGGKLFWSCSGGPHSVPESSSPGAFMDHSGPPWVFQGVTP